MVPMIEKVHAAGYSRGHANIRGRHVAVHDVVSVHIGQHIQGVMAISLMTSDPLTNVVATLPMTSDQFTNVMATSLMTSDQSTNVAATLPRSAHVTPAVALTQTRRRPGGVYLNQGQVHRGVYLTWFWYTPRPGGGPGRQAPHALASDFVNS